MILAVIIFIVTIIFFLPKEEPQSSKVVFVPDFSILKTEPNSDLNLEYNSGSTELKTPAGQVLARLSGDYSNHNIREEFDRITLYSENSLVVIEDNQVATYSLENTIQDFIVSPDKQILYTDGVMTYLFPSNQSFLEPLENFAFDGSGNLYLATEKLELIKGESRETLLELPEEVRNIQEFEMSQSGTTALIKTDYQDFKFFLEKI